MAPHDDSDWSDSDDEELSEMETPVLLGIPDGTIEKREDAGDAAVSRIGGYPVRNVVLYSIACTVNNRHFFLAFLCVLLTNGVKPFESRHSCPNQSPPFQVHNA